MPSVYFLCNIFSLTFLQPTEDSSQKTNELNDTTLLAVDPEERVVMKVDITDGEAETETFGPWPIDTISTVAFDPLEQLVYFSDPIGGYTLKVPLTGRNSEYISSTDGKYPHDIILKILKILKTLKILEILNILKILT